jgi:spore maturation protein CgeB
MTASSPSATSFASCTGHRDGPRAPGPGTRRPTSALPADAGEPREGDLVWIGNWGDDERAAELEEFLVGPVQALGLKATVHGVRYPAHALARLQAAGLRYAGWLPNHEAPRVFAGHRVTVHVPRRPYVEALPGIPTIRVFEALACGIALVSAPWRDAEGCSRLDATSWSLVTARPCGDTCTRC